MVDEYLRLGDFPKEFQDVLMREFAPYSVGMGWVSSSTRQTFTPFGSRTLVSKNGKVGVLTAQHCVREMHHTSRGHDTGGGEWGQISTFNISLSKLDVVRALCANRIRRILCATAA